ncbi:MAG: hypothetical protein ACRD1K_00330 [Acidimicrobiales bacterium]
MIEDALVDGLPARETAALANTAVVPKTLASLRKGWNRAMAGVARQLRGSSRWAATKARIARGHARVGHLRSDCLNNVTTPPASPLPTGRW